MSISIKRGTKPMDTMMLATSVVGIILVVQDTATDKDLVAFRRAVGQALEDLLPSTAYLLEHTLEELEKK